MLSRWRSSAMIVIGAATFAFGLNQFIIPNEFTEGGITGIAILLKYLFNFSLGYTTLLLNIPLFIIGWKVLGRNAMAFTILGTVSLSFFLWLTEGWFQPIDAEPLLNVLYAGVTAGIGLGIIFRYGGTTGGVDIIARVANKMFGWSIGRTMFIADILVIGGSVLIIPLPRVMYTLVAVFISSRIIDFVIDGAYAAKAATIISDHAPDIADKVMLEMDRGITLLKGKGAYTGADKEVLYCVVYRGEVVRLKNLVRTIDPRAFIVVSNVHDVLGEGFRED